MSIRDAAIASADLPSSSSSSSSVETGAATSAQNDASADTPDRVLYNVVGVVEHRGRGIDRGHYVAFTRNALSDQWLRFDDDKVAAVTDTEVLAAQAYLVFCVRRRVKHEKTV